LVEERVVSGYIELIVVKRAGNITKMFIQNVQTCPR
jgi:hypothetical protein